MGDIQVRRLPVLNRDKRLVAASLRWATSRWRKPATARARR
jgi:hypothetical protein